MNPLESIDVGFGTVWVSRFSGSSEEIDSCMEEFMAAETEWVHSHPVGDRWENTYLPLSRSPATRAILSRIRELAETICPAHLYIPTEPSNPESNQFWFNLARPGERTERHRHSAKATFSAVCYLAVPAYSGNIRFHGPDETQTIGAERGRVLLFPPTLPHSVDVNRSEENRLSLACNLFDRKP